MAAVTLHSPVRTRAGVRPASRPAPAPTRPDVAVPVVTVVIPTRNAARTMEPALTAVRAQHDAAGVPLAVELVVVDNHSTDATRTIASRLADVLLIGGPERSAQRNHGTEVASADVIAFVDADQLLAPTVLAEALACLRADPGVGVVVLPETSFGSGFWARCRALERRCTMDDPRTEAGRVFRRDAVRQVGGFDERLTAAEDWDLHDRVVRAGWRVGRTVAGVRHDEGHLTLRGAFTKKRYYGRWLAAYRARPDARRSVYSPTRLLRRPQLLLAHPLLAVGMVVLKAAEALGALAGERAAGRPGRVEPSLRVGIKTNPGGADGTGTPVVEHWRRA